MTNSNMVVLHPSTTVVDKPRIERAVREHGWRPGHMQRVSSGFYTSQAWEWKRT